MVSRIRRLRCWSWRHAFASALRSCCCRALVASTSRSSTCPVSSVSSTAFVVGRARWRARVLARYSVSAGERSAVVAAKAARIFPRASWELALWRQELSLVGSSSPAWSKPIPKWDVHFPIKQATRGFIRFPVRFRHPPPHHGQSHPTICALHLGFSLGYGRLREPLAGIQRLGIRCSNLETPGKRSGPVYCACMRRKYSGARGRIDLLGDFSSAFYSASE